MAKGVSGDKWNLGAMKDMTTEKFWAWAKVDAIDESGDIFTGQNRCNYFGKELWFELGNSMWKKHQRTFQDHVKYIHNNTVKHFRLGILHCA